MVAALVMGGVVCTALINGSRIYYRPEDWLLVRKYTPQTGNLEVFRNTGFCSNGRWSHHDGTE